MSDIDISKEDLKVLSPTSLNTYLRCPRMFFYAKIAKAIPRPKDKSAAELGRVAHKILEMFDRNFNLEELISVGDVSKYFHTLLDKMIDENWNYQIQSPFANNEKLKEETRKFLNEYIDLRIITFNERAESNTLETFFPLAVEEDITSEKSLIRCIIDRRNYNNTLVDYKTGKYFPEILLRQYSTLTPEEKKQYDKTKLTYEVQAVMNAIVVHDKYGIIPPKMTFLFPRHLKASHKGILTVEITQERMSRISNLINNVANSIRNNEYQKTEDKSVCSEYGGCEYKHYCDFDNICIMSL